MINPLTLIPGNKLGEKIYNGLVFIAILGLVGYVGFGIVSGKFWHWRANVANERADRAEAVAEVEKQNAANADGSAVNAQQTREAIDTGKMEIVFRTEQSATRAESNEPTTVDPSGALDDDLVQELDAARSRAGSAANRLQRKGSR